MDRIHVRDILWGKLTFFNGEDSKYSNDREIKLLNSCPKVGVMTYSRRVDPDDETRLIRQSMAPPVIIGSEELCCKVPVTDLRFVFHGVLFFFALDRELRSEAPFFFLHAKESVKKNKKEMEISYT